MTALNTTSCDHAVLSNSQYAIIVLIMTGFGPWVIRILFMIPRIIKYCCFYSDDETPNPSSPNAQQVDHPAGTHERSYGTTGYFKHEIKTLHDKEHVTNERTRFMILQILKEDGRILHNGYERFLGVASDRKEYLEKGNWNRAIDDIQIGDTIIRETIYKYPESHEKPYYPPVDTVLNILTDPVILVQLFAVTVLYGVMDPTDDHGQRRLTEHPAEIVQTDKRITRADWLRKMALNEGSVLVQWRGADQEPNHCYNLGFGNVWWKNYGSFGWFMEDKRTPTCALFVRDSIAAIVYSLTDRIFWLGVILTLIKSESSGQKQLLCHSDVNWPLVFLLFPFIFRFGITLLVATYSRLIFERNNGFYCQSDRNSYLL